MICPQCELRFLISITFPLEYLFESEKALPINATVPSILKIGTARRLSIVTCSYSRCFGNETDSVYEVGGGMFEGGRQLANRTVNMTSGMSREFDNGASAWLLSCTAITWLMIPGVGFFYNGMAPKKSSLVLITTCLWSCAVVSIQWYIVGYTLCLSNTGGPFIGNLYHLLLRNIDDLPAFNNHEIPALLLGVWYCLFAAITPTIILGGIVERARFLPSVVFIFLWSTFVFDVVAYWTFNDNGWNSIMGGLDFAGGTPIHISTAASALAYALILGKRKDTRDKPPHNMTHVILGMSFIWSGWLVANAGSALRPNLRSTLVFVTTNLSASIGGLVWGVMDYWKEKRFSAFGFCCGVICGLVAITPASGFVTPSSSVVFGAAGAIVGNVSRGIKKYLRIDDSFDVFAVHGLCGIVGNILTGVFAQKGVAAVDGTKIKGGLLDGNYMQVTYQIVDTLAGAAWSFLITLIIVWVLDKVPTLRLRVDPEVEEAGIDDAELGEPMYLFVNEIEERLNTLSASSNQLNGSDLETRERSVNTSQHIEMGSITHLVPVP